MSEPTHTNNIKTRTPLEQKITFFFVCVGVIALTYGLLYVIDFLPEKPGEKTLEEQIEYTPTTSNESATENIDPLPAVIIFDTQGGREVPVFNPETDSVPELDANLLKGVVRHPDSADFSNKGTIFILGHSSYLPNVMNKNFQAFNGIQKLKWGDTIRLRSKDTEYVYSVDRVYEAKASDAEVPIQYEEPKLILATCNSFATKDDRFVVEASLVESHPIVEAKG